jgi:topoisomerase-4 subunit B
MTMTNKKPNAYTEDNIRTLEPREHIRLRPGMYIGKLGDGSSQEDGIYVLLKEVIDNAIDEHMQGYGNCIEVTIEDKRVSVRDYGRGIPLGKVIDCVSKINTGAKYDSEAFQKSIGLNGVGTKAVNALSSYFMVQSIREGKTKIAEFERGVLVKDHPLKPCSEPDGTLVVFEPDDTIFKHFKFIPQFVENLLWNYAFLNAGLTLTFNGKKFVSQDGLLDLLRRKVNEEEIRYPIIHLKGKDIEIAMTHGSQYGEDYYSFVNGQYTSQGGTHQQAFREAIVKTVREFYKKDFDTTDIRASIVAAISIRVQEPIFESQTKTKLGSTNLSPDPSSPTIRAFVNDFVKKELDNYLHQHPQTAEALLKRIQQSEKERNEIAGIRKLAKERVKKASLHNSKLRDCRIHFNDSNKEERFETTIFITEGDSASGSMTKARDVRTQAVFSLRGKPLNCWNASKKVVYENEELNLLHHALGLDEGLEGLRYNRVVIATDADTDGMHIRLLLLTFFLRFYPDLVRHGHVYILETPLFRVRNKKQTIYCYSEQEKVQAVEKLGKGVEITRFKGLGEISPEEFKQFIGEDMRLEPVILQEHTNIEKLLSYYMGNNTSERQNFIINNLRIEADTLDPRLAERVALEA